MTVCISLVSRISSTCVRFWKNSLLTLKITLSHCTVSVLTTLRYKVAVYCYYGESILWKWMRSLHPQYWYLFFQMSGKRRVPFTILSPKYQKRRFLQRERLTALVSQNFKKRLCLQFITLKRFVLSTLSLLQSYLICLFMYSWSIDRPGGVYRKPWKLIEYCRSVTAVYRLASRAKTTIKCLYFEPLYLQSQI